MIKENLHRLLKEKNITRYRLAITTGFSHTYINGLYNGIIVNPSFKHISAIAKALDVSITEFEKEC